MSGGPYRLSGILALLVLSLGGAGVGATQAPASAAPGQKPLAALTGTASILGTVVEAGSARPVRGAIVSLSKNGGGFTTLRVLADGDAELEDQVR